MVRPSCLAVQSVQTWYFKKKEWKSCWGRGLRFTSVGALALAAIFPVISQMTSTVPPGIAAILIAIAGTCVLLDRLGGFTSGWVRYVTTAQRFGLLVDNFQFDWEKAKLSAGGAAAADLVQRLNLCHDFLSKVNEVVVEETKQWAADFQSVLNSIDAAAQTAAKAQATGSLEVAIANADKATDGWKLQIDGRPETLHTGSTAAIKDLAPGTYVVSASGTIDNKPVKVSHSVKIDPGQSSKTAFKLE